MLGVEGTSLGTDARYAIEELQPGGIILLGRNVVSPSQLRDLTEDLQRAAHERSGQYLFISTDQEGGNVQRLLDGFTRIPSAAAMGARGPAYARSVAGVAGAELAAVGVNMDLAPVLDVNDNPQNPVIGPRAFGTTPDVVVASALAFMDGLRGAGVVAVGKHFPGHGNTDTDSHLALPVVRKTREQLEMTELVPFRAAAAANIPALMVAHVAYPALDPSLGPATTSSRIMTDLLRGEMGFAGLVLTDDMGMAGISAGLGPEEAAVQAFLAGADMLICVRSTLQPSSCPPEQAARMRNGLMAAVEDGRISEARLAASVARIKALKHAYGVGSATKMTLESVGSAQHRAVIDGGTTP